jgi:hypothetical protein
MSSRRSTMLWLLVALAVFAGGTLFSRLEKKKAESPSWQRPVAELTAEQQRFYGQLREFLRAAERERGNTKRWPEATNLFPDGWARLQQGVYVNYLGEREGLRWLVLFIEPDGRTPPEDVPEDDEHHRLSDGTAIHVTVWTQEPSAPASERVTAFPAAEGWVERVSR